MSQRLSYEQVAALAASTASDAAAAFGGLVIEAATRAYQATRDYAGWMGAGGLWFNPAQAALGDFLGDGTDPWEFPADPIIGGQCTCATYQVTYKDKRPGIDVNLTANWPGPISDVQFRNEGGGMRAYVNVGGPGCGGRREESIWSNVTPADFANGLAEARIISIVPNAGQPNDCGNVPYTPAPVLPSPEDLVFGYTFSPTPTTNIPVDIVIKPPAIEFPILPGFDVNISPTVSVPGLGINFNFDIGGVNITLSPEFNINLAPNLPFDNGTQPDRVKPRLPAFNTDVDCDNQDVLDRLDEIDAKLDEIEECACDRPFTVSTQTLVINGSGNVALPDDTFLVQVELQPPLSRYRSQSGQNGASVYYAGWAWFSYRGGGFSERMPIDSNNKNFLPESEIPARFSYTVTMGGTCLVTVYYKVYS